MCKFRCSLVIFKKMTALFRIFIEHPSYVVYFQAVLCPGNVPFMTALVMNPAMGNDPLGGGTVGQKPHHQGRFPWQPVTSFNLSKVSRF